MSEELPREEPLIPFRRPAPPRAQGEPHSPLKEFSGLKKLADEVSGQRSTSVSQEIPASTQSRELADALSRLKATELPAPIMAVAESLLTCAHAAANDMEAQASQLEDTATMLRRDAQALRDEGQTHADGIQSVARNIKTGTARARSAIALAHQARTGGGSSS